MSEPFDFTSCKPSPPINPSLVQQSGVHPWPIFHRQFHELSRHPRETRKGVSVSFGQVGKPVRRTKINAIDGWIEMERNQLGSRSPIFFLHNPGYQCGIYGVPDIIESESDGNQEKHIWEVNESPRIQNIRVGTSGVQKCVKRQFGGVRHAS